MSNNVHFLQFFGLLSSSATPAPASPEVMGRTRQHTVELDQPTVLSLQERELATGARLTITRSLMQRPSVPKQLDRIIGLQLAIEAREDVVLCQSLSIAVSAFLTTLESIAAGEREWASLEGGAATTKTMPTYIVASKRLLQSVGFCLSVESLLTPFGAEKGMLEDLDEAVRMLNTRVQLVAVQQARVGGGNECTQVEVVESEQTADGSCRIRVYLALVADCYEIVRPHWSVPEAGCVNSPAAPELEPQPEPQCGGGGQDGELVVPLRAFLFSQGVNEQADLSNTGLFNVGELECTINKASARYCEKLFEVFERKEAEWRWRADAGSTYEHTAVKRRLSVSERFWFMLPLNYNDIQGDELTGCSLETLTVDTAQDGQQL